MQKLHRMRAGLPPTEEPVESTSESETTPLTVSTPPGESFVCECREMEGSFENAEVSEGPSGIFGTPSSSNPTIEGSSDVARDASIIVGTPSRGGSRI